jgi:hypothetical protein
MTFVREAGFVSTPGALTSPLFANHGLFIFVDPLDISIEQRLGFG